MSVYETLLKKTIRAMSNASLYIESKVLFLVKCPCATSIVDYLRLLSLSLYVKKSRIDVEAGNAYCLIRSPAQISK